MPLMEWKVKVFYGTLVVFLRCVCVSETVRDQEELDGKLLHDKSLLVISVLVLVYSALQISHSAITSMIMKDVSM